MTRSWSPAVFDRLYASRPDPWQLASSPYEAAKYAASLAALGDRRFASALELGCSIGVLTRRLARCCDRLLAVDFAEAALVAARLACADQPQVSFLRASIPAGFPAGSYDLILLSEIIYFLDPGDIRRTAGRAMSSLAPDGLLLLVNYLGETDSPTTGDAAATLFIEACGLTPSLQQRTPGYRLDLLRR